MKNVKYIIFRYLTNADFFNINKPAGTEAKGGGQTYIDFPVASIPLKYWQDFFNTPQVKVSTRASGPCWSFTVNNIGLKTTQPLTIYQRRPQSISIAAQRINSKRSNRLETWQPKNGFPAPLNPQDRQTALNNLAIYIICSEDGDYWAGWFQGAIPCADATLVSELQKHLGNSKQIEGHSNFLEFSPGILRFDETSTARTFCQGAQPQKKVKPVNLRIAPSQKRIKQAGGKTTQKQHYVRKIKTEEDMLKGLFEDDEINNVSASRQIKEVVKRIKSRNTKAAKALKTLYKGVCQISADQHAFLKKNGQLYCEAHHLIPLGALGADSPYNIVIISPLIHRMLHYANVEPFNLTQIKPDHTLDIKINGTTHTIKWHPKHAELVKKYAKI